MEAGIILCTPLHSVDKISYKLLCRFRLFGVDQGIALIKSAVCVSSAVFISNCHWSHFLSLKVAKHSKTNLADVALAGLASKENFRKVSLRSVKSTDVVTNNSALPFNKLMLIRIKGEKRRLCVFVSPIII